MAYDKVTRISKLLSEIRAQRGWMQQCGQTLAGYRINYGVDHDADAIFAADSEALAAQLSELEHLTGGRVADAEQLDAIDRRFTEVLDEIKQIRSVLAAATAAKLAMEMASTAGFVIMGETENERQIALRLQLLVDRAARRLAAAEDSLRRLVGQRVDAVRAVEAGDAESGPALYVDGVRQS